MSTRKYIRNREIKKIERWVKKLKKDNDDCSKARRRLKLKFKVLACGKSRIAYDISHGLVLKVALSKKGAAQIKKEVEVYKRSTSSLRKHLSKIKDKGRGWVIMKRAKMSKNKSLRYISQVRKLERRFKKRGIIMNDILTRKSKMPKWQNIGQDKQGRPVIIDYGHFKVKR